MLDVTIEQHRLATAISAALSVAGKVVPNQPATSGVLLRAAKAGLTVTCTDLMLTSSELLESRVDTTIDKDGVALVPARHVLQAVKSLPAGPVRLRGLENQWLQINAKRSEFKLMGTPATDFPDLQVPPGKGWTPTPAPALLGLIKATIASVSTDEARVNLNGLLLESTGKRATAVSTDGHRLTKLVADLAGPPQEPGARRRIECGQCHKFYYWLPKIKNINKRPPSSTGLARGAVCQCCLKAGVALVGHHVVPVADGGSDAQDNIWTVCSACHAIIHALRRMVEQA
jgi:hypothetical protein